MRVPRPSPRARAIAVAVMAAIALAGCSISVGPGATPTGVTVTVTRDFGAHKLLALASPKVHGEATVMSLLMRNADVSTRYGGGFVQGIDGQEGGHEDGRPIDWFYYINGVEAAKGAAATQVHPGERIWWDLHDWSATQRTPAVVGSFPEPFTDGIEGKRLPVRVECEDPQSPPCHAVTTALTKLEVPFGFSIVGGGGEEAEDAITLLVGTWPQLRRSAAAQLLERGPSASGVYVRMLGGGKDFALLDAHGDVTRTLASDSGLIAATKYPNEGPSWIVTGTDPAGVLLAAKSFDEKTLGRRFAVAVTAAGPGASPTVIPLPDEGGSESESR